MKKIFKSLVVLMCLTLTMTACTSTSTSKNSSENTININHISINDKSLDDGEFVNFPWNSTIEEVTKNIRIDYGKTTIGKINTNNEFTFEIPVYYDDFDMYGTAEFLFLVDTDESGKATSALKFVFFKSVIEQEDASLDKFVSDYKEVLSSFEGKKKYAFEDISSVEKFADLAKCKSSLQYRSEDTKMESTLVLPTVYELMANNKFGEEQIKAMQEANSYLYGGENVVWQFNEVIELNLD